MIKKTGSIIGALMKKRAAAEAGQDSSGPDPSRTMTVAAGAAAPGAKPPTPAMAPAGPAPAPLRSVDPPPAAPVPSPDAARASAAEKPVEPPKVKKSYALTRSHVEDIERLAWLWNTSASQVVDQALGEFVAKRAREIASAADLLQAAEQRRTA
jgi:hypothetical protein